MYKSCNLRGCRRGAINLMQHLLPAVLQHGDSIISHRQVREF